MGCDIHTWIEVRETEYENGEKVEKGWKNATPFFVNRYYDPESDHEPDRQLLVMEDGFAIPSRDYPLFSLLAGVRNGYGFAGFPTGEPVEPWFEGRGMPEDLSDDIQAAVDEWGSDLHSQTYCTLEELQAKVNAAPETPGQALYDYYTLGEYVKLKAGEEADEAGLFMRSTPLIHHSQADQVIEANEVDKLPEEAIVVVPHPRMQSEFINQLEQFTLPLLKMVKYQHYVKDDQIRLIVGFDN